MTRPKSTPTTLDLATPVLQAYRKSAPSDSISFGLRPVRTRSTAIGKRVDRGDDSTVRRTTFRKKGQFSSFPVLGREFDLDSALARLLGTTPADPMLYTNFTST
jgi:hypothetical protein